MAESVSEPATVAGGLDDLSSRVVYLGCARARHHGLVGSSLRFLDKMPDRTMDQETAQGSVRAGEPEKSGRHGAQVLVRNLTSIESERLTGT